MRRFACLLLAGCLSSGVAAQTMYKCQANGKVEYSSKPCPAGSDAKRLQADAAPSAEDQAAARDRLRRGVERQEAAEASQREAAARATAASLANARAYDRARQPAPAPERHLVHTGKGWERMTAEERTAYESARAAQRQEAADRATAAAIAQGSKPIPTTPIGPAGWCTSAGCTDSAGGAFTGAAGLPGRYTSPSGGSCYRSGSAIYCQ